MALGPQLLGASITPDHHWDVSNPYPVIKMNRLYKVSWLIIHIRVKTRSQGQKNSCWAQRQDYNEARSLWNYTEMEKSLEKPGVFPSMALASVWANQENRVMKQARKRTQWPNYCVMQVFCFKWKGKYLTLRFAYTHTERSPKNGLKHVKTSISAC